MALQDKYINPFTDFGFKRIFGTEVNKELLIDFLNHLLPAYHQIQELSYTPTEQLGTTEIDRKAIFDLYCQSISGERFIVEIQKVKQNFFKDRSVYYATFPIREQAKQGSWDYRLSAVYTVGILDFTFREDKKEQKVLHKVKLKDQDCQIFYDKLTFFYLEVPHFQKTEEELTSTWDKWLYVLKHLPNLEGRPQALQEQIFQKLFDAAEIAKFDPQELMAYEDSLKYYRDLNNVIETAYEEGEEKGRLEGIEEGRIEVILTAYESGMELSQIALITGKTKEEVVKIIEKHQ